MKTRLMAIFLLTGYGAFSQMDSTNLVKIGAAAAAQHYDQLMTVTGKVAQVTLRPSIVFINLDQPYPDSPFAAVIHSKDTNQFGNLKALTGRSVEITGTVQNYRDKPEIVLTNSSQIFVLGGWAAATNSVSAPAEPKSTTSSN